MSWLKIDDQFFFHRKVINLSKDAKLLHLCAMTYCASQARTGILTPAVVRLAAAAVDAKSAAIAELVKAELWVKDEEGNYAIHDFTKYNPSPEQIAMKKAGNIERQQRYRERHQPPANDKSNAVTNAVTDSVGNATNNSHGNVCLSRTPVNPSPSPNPDMYTNPSLDTTTTTLPGGMGGEASSRDEEQSRRLSSEEKDSSNTKNEKRDTIRRQFIEVTLTEHPDWKSPLDLTVQNASPDDETAYRTSVLRRWIGGDGTPPEPSSALVPVGQAASTATRLPRFPPKETAEEINARVVNRLAGNGFFNSGGNPQ